VVVVLVASLLGVSGGAVAMSPGDVLRALLGEGDATQVAIVQNLRLPRVALGLAVGAGLAVSGAALQTTLRNPLAEPYLLGVSGGAAAGAVAAVTLGVASAALLPLAAFAGAVVAVLVVLLVARAVAGHADPRVLLMAGVVVGAFCTALIMVALATAPENTVRGALWWMMGSLGDAQWRGLRWIALYVALGIALLVVWARDVDVLALGEDAAASLGLPVERVTRHFIDAGVWTLAYAAPAPNITARPTLRPLVTCTEIVKSALGLRAWHVITPHQLARELRRRGAVPVLPLSQPPLAQPALAAKEP